MAIGRRNWVCCQLGAREHYAVPRALWRRQSLSVLYTDYWASSFARGALSLRPFGLLSSLASRFHADLIDADVVSWNLSALAWELHLRRRCRVGGVDRRYREYAQLGRRFGALVARSMARRFPASQSMTVFTYDTTGLEVLRWCRGWGHFSILGQMDPASVEVVLTQEEDARWRGWQQKSHGLPQEYIERRQEEWSLAHRVVVNSEFSRRALVAQNVPAEKIAVIPLCYEASAGKPLGTCERKTQVSGLGRSISSPLRVLFLGQVILRKGIQYLIEAAKLLSRENIEFHVVGPIGISEEAARSAPASMRFHGRAVRDRASQWYQSCDLFVLPTISDGFALTQLEAMAHGLPVVATPNCGEVVRPGIDGLIVPIRDPAALAQAIMRFANEPEWRRACSENALERVKDFSLDKLATNLLALAPKP